MKALLCALVTPLCVTSAEKLTYPEARIVDQTDLYGEVRVRDPYRWLENSDSADTRAWIEAQNGITMPWLRSIPERQAIYDRVRQLWNYERYTGTFKAGGRYFWLHNTGLLNRAVIYTSESLNGKGEVLIDPNGFADKTMGVAEISADRTGKIVAYALQTAGSDWREIAFIEAATRKPLPDRLQWVKFSSIEWDREGKGVYYSRYDAPEEGNKLQASNENQKAFYHRLGTPQSEDRLIFYDAAHKDRIYGAAESSDGRYILLRVDHATSPNTAWFCRPADSEKWIQLLPNFDAQYDLVGTDGDRFLFRTTKDAPRGRVIAISADEPEPANWKTIVPEARDTLEAVSLRAGSLVATYLKDARSVIRLFDRSGKHVRDIDLPGLGTAFLHNGYEEEAETFYTFTSHASPGVVYVLDAKSGTTRPFRTPHLAIDLSQFETHQVFYHSKDGTRIPMFLTHRKGLKRDGNNPVLLYGYGGFNVPMSPFFSVANLVWLDMGGVFATPGLRGGGEYGHEWHMAGTRDRKQNVFDDFVGAAEWLIANKYTRPSRLAINGGSNGGLLVGASILQRPDLFGAAVAEVGVFDMLRFHKFTIGHFWTSDYGSPDKPEDFKALYAYSPYHNVKKGTKYPATLLLTADHDDRVIPAHSFKFAAALQAAQGAEAPVLIRIQTKAGHGSGIPLNVTMEERADVLAFLVKTLGMRVPPIAGGSTPPSTSGQAGGSPQ